MAEQSLIYATPTRPPSSCHLLLRGFDLCFYTVLSTITLGGIERMQTWIEDEGIER